MKAALLALLLAGCTSIPQGVEMTAEEAAVCAEQGCTVWSVRELQILMRKAWVDGYGHGKASI